MTHAASPHATLAERDMIDVMTELADKMRDLAKDAQRRESELAEARLLLGLALDVIKKGSYHATHQHQVAGVKQQIRRVL